MGYPKAMTRRYLVYCPCESSVVAAKMFGSDRTYDIALNNYDRTLDRTSKVEYRYTMRGHKWPCISTLIAPLVDKYDAFCFLDNDISITTTDLNNLFEIGSVCGLSLWQASLTKESTEWWKFLYHQNGHVLREVPLVEMMMPCFSRETLKLCLDTFTENHSGWGIDLLWSKMLADRRLVVVDAIQASHVRPVQSHKWVLPGCVTSAQERDKLYAKYNLRMPDATRGY